MYASHFIRQWIPLGPTVFGLVFDNLYGDSIFSSGSFIKAHGCILVIGQ